MIYQMKQKLFALGDDFTIKDGQGRDVFLVDGRLISLGDQLAFRDMAGNELAFIKQKLLAWGPTYEIWRAGELRAVVKKALFTFLHHEYTFSRSGRPVATVSKRWFSLTDTYGVEIAEGEDDVLILAGAVVIDMVHEDAKDHD